MKIVDIQYLSPIIKFDPQNDCIDIIAKMDDGQAAAITVCTATYLPTYMLDNNMRYLPPNSDIIIVESLAQECVLQAVEAYTQNEEFWNRLINAQ